jgi:predicted DNA-binding protein (UPF0251 family)
MATRGYTPVKVDCRGRRPTLDASDRVKVRALHRDGVNPDTIAKKMRVSRMTIYRELKAAKLETSRNWPSVRAIVDALAAVDGARQSRTDVVTSKFACGVDAPFVPVNRAQFHPTDFLWARPGFKTESLTVANGLRRTDAQARRDTSAMREVQSLLRAIGEDALAAEEVAA